MKTESSDSIRILLVEDVPSDAELARWEITREVKACEIHRVETREDFLAELAAFQPHVIISDCSLPRFDGLAALRLAQERAPLTPLIILTGSNNEDIAVNCMKAGASNYVIKEHMKRLGQTVMHAWEEGRLRREELAAKQAVQKGEHYFRSLIENAHDLITVLDAQGVVLFQSPSVQRLLGYSPAELVDRNIFELVHPDDRVRAGESMLRVIEGEGRANSVGFRIRHADGSWRMLESAGNRLEADGAAAIVVNSRDVTERQRLEEQLRQAQKMEAVGHLASGVAHDFNNVLTTIMGNASLLRQDDPFAASHADEINDITAAAERASRLTRQLLLFSRKQTLQLTQLDLNDAVAQMAKMLRRVLGEDIRVVLDCDPGLPLTQADAGMIDQVLLNLAVNARDAMSGGGQLTFRTAVRTTVPPDPSARRMVCLSVSDTGAGIHPDHLPHIFEPFFTTKAAGKGTGLGLATVYGTVKQHGGTVEVASHLGRGTTFLVELPAVEGGEVAALPGTESLLAPAGNELILLVEDEVSVRLMANRLLQRCGYQVLAAQSGPEALEIWAEHQGRIQLLLTDVIMPGGMTGHELAGRLRPLAPGLRVIYSSGYSPELAGQKVRSEPGVCFLQKPYSLLELAKAVRACLDERVS